MSVGGKKKFHWSGQIKEIKFLSFHFLFHSTLQGDPNRLRYFIKSRYTFCVVSTSAHHVTLNKMDLNKSKYSKVFIVQITSLYPNQHLLDEWREKVIINDVFFQVDIIAGSYNSVKLLISWQSFSLTMLGYKKVKNNDTK